MNDFFRKLNVLVKSSLNELLDSEGEARRPRISPDKLGGDVRMLRQRVDDALKYEDELAARVDSLQTEVERRDQQADEAMAQGQEDNARRHVEELQRLQNRLAMAESDLREHRLVTQELISRVNQLEAVVDEARSQQTLDAAVSEPLERASQMMTDVLREMRDRINEMTEAIGTAEPKVHTESPPADEEAVDDDLARRRERLSKK
jgi:phage shock protein A